MRFTSLRNRTAGVAIVSAFIASLLVACSGGGSGTLPQVQQPNNPPPPPPAPSSGSVSSVSVTLSSADMAAAAAATNLQIHLNLRSSGISPKDVHHPFNVVSHGGPVMATATQFPVFLNCSGTPVGHCWGDPITFMKNLNASTFIHTTDQYVGVTTNNRYPVGTAVNVTDTADLHFTNVLDQFELLGNLHAAVVADGKKVGTTALYHVFLPSGVDHCIEFTAQCYSPDNSASFVFCGYHGAVTFPDISSTPAIFSVEPFQNVAGCQVPGTLPNPVPQDATDSTLSHEEFEAITDPELNAWFDPFGFEVGDLCHLGAPLNFFETVSLNAHSYRIQEEWSNAVSGCAP
jgi:hypothetical protein